MDKYYSVLFDVIEVKFIKYIILKNCKDDCYYKDCLYIDILMI